MRRILVSFTVFFAACSASPPVPKDVLPPDKMEAVLYDVIRVDEMVDFMRMSDSTYQPFSKRTALYDSVFQFHQTRKDAFQKSMKYYQGRPDLLKEIFENLQKKVSDTTKIKKPTQVM